MADENEPPTGTEPEFLWAFGEKIPKSQLSRVPLDMEPPMGGGEPLDLYNDEHWQWSHYRSPKLLGVLDIQSFSNHLQDKAKEEYAARRREIPAAEIAAEEERQARLRELVSRAVQTDDQEIWR